MPGGAPLLPRFQSIVTMFSDAEAVADSLAVTSDTPSLPTRVPPNPLPNPSGNYNLPNSGGKAVYLWADISFDRSRDGLSGRRAVCGLAGPKWNTAGG